MNEELKYYLAFDSLTGIGLGYRRTCNLIEFFGTAQIAWQAKANEFKAISSIPEDVLEAFINKRNNINPEEILEKVLNKKVKPFCQNCPEYPQQLLDLKDPPLILYTKGHWDKSWLERAVSIVGTRDVSQIGAQRTKEIAAELASGGFTVISGLALGVDAEAHKGALMTNGRTIAVVANGLDLIVPASNHDIYEQIFANGCLVSEYPPGTEPMRGFFPARNRIIAALSNAVLVTEAGLKSGALITAERAIELRKPLFGLAGSANNKTAEGINYWIRKGKAIFVTSATDILEELNVQPLKLQLDIPIQTQAIYKPQTKISLKVPVKLSEDEQKLYDLIPYESFLSVDKLIEKTALSVAKVNSILLTMQLKRLITKDLNGGVSKV